MKTPAESYIVMGCLISHK